MTRSSRVSIGWPALLTGALALVAAGAGLAYVVVRSSTLPSADRHADTHGAPAAGGHPSPTAVAAPATDLVEGEVVVNLTPEAMERGGIVLGTVKEGSGAIVTRLPGVIEPNAYKQVVVTPLVSGRVRRVFVALGESVRAGQPLAEIFSPELAEAETRFVSARAELAAHERELQRTEKLVDIGSASRQELERLHAEHTARETEVQTARSRLQLLGVPASTIEKLGSGNAVGALTTVPAPMSGVVTERTANPGLNVDSAAKLFAVVDLSTVWVVVDVYEKDFSGVRAGVPARITTKALADAVIPGRVSYIDPQVNAETRTVRVRVEVPNPRHELRLGMFVDVTLDVPGVRAVALIPRAAVQHVGTRTVVYLADPKQPGRFVEREIRLGDRSANDVAVLGGVQPGDAIVTDGSFAVRAERDRLGAHPGHAGQVH
jgi:RND family efflux transporter MFP subunit